MDHDITGHTSSELSNRTEKQNQSAEENDDRLVAATTMNSLPRNLESNERLNSTQQEDLVERLSSASLRTATATLGLIIIQ